MPTPARRQNCKLLSSQRLGDLSAADKWRNKVQPKAPQSKAGLEGSQIAASAITTYEVESQSNKHKRHLDQ
jgi:hypothetical protein